MAIWNSVRWLWLQSRTYTMWEFSQGPFSGAADVLTLIRKALCEKIGSISSHLLVPGRVQLVECSSTDSHGNEDGSLAVMNVHNDRLSAEQIDELCEKINLFAKKSRRLGPRFLFFVGGDWNFLAPGDLPVTTEHLPAPAPAEYSAATRRLQKALANLTLITSEDPTHFNARRRYFSVLD